MLQLCFRLGVNFGYFIHSSHPFPSKTIFFSNCWGCFSIEMSFFICPVYLSHFFVVQGWFQFKLFSGWYSFICVHGWTPCCFSYICVLSKEVGTFQEFPICSRVWSMLHYSFNYSGHSTHYLKLWDEFDHLLLSILICILFCAAIIHLGLLELDCPSGHLL